MQTNDLTPEKLRELADLRPDNARVLSLFLNLDPTEFATPPARGSEVRSVIDQAERSLKELKENDGLTHDELKALRDDIDRAREWFNNGDFDAKGAHGLALYLAGPAGLFEVVKLPRPVQTNAVVDDSPYIEPIADLTSRAHWGVLLVSRRNGRILRGTSDGLREVDQVWDDTHGQHDQGGWSQARYQRSVEEEKKDHVRAVLDVLFEHHKRAPVDCLLVGCNEELYPDVQQYLHPYLKERLVGRFDVDVEVSKPEDVFKAAQPKIEEHESQRERDALDRLTDGVNAGGRGVAGVERTLDALNEQRVEKLLVNYGFDPPGTQCPQCRALYQEDVARCPADDTPTERRDSIIEPAFERALAQSAEVIVVRYNGPEIEELGNIGAVLRF
jgi:peptide subunit release factor 1 (eRF1)